MTSIGSLAMRRLRYNRGRSVLTIVAIALTACLLTALAVGALGLIDFQKRQAIADGNHHATLYATQEQLEILSRHALVEAVSVDETVASVVYEKMNARLKCARELRPGVDGYTLAAGRFPQAAGEIAGPPVFFERIGEKAEIGASVQVRFRAREKGEILSEEFTIVGLLVQPDMSGLDVSDTRLAYTALVSEELAAAYPADAGERLFVRLRVAGEGELDFDAMCQRVLDVAEDAGIDADGVSTNLAYLLFMTDPAAEMRMAVLMAGALISLFSGLVVYSIYYVSIISGIQELGKLCALGATRRQMRGLVLREGLILTLAGLPAGLLLGHLAAYGFMRFITGDAAQSVMRTQVAVTGIPFSPPTILLVSAVIVFTVAVSLRGPMRMAARISPVEAMRYQEDGVHSRAARRGYSTISLPRLTMANLGRNRRRTLVTMMTMGLSCVLFITVACLMSSVNPRDYARRTLPMGDFLLWADYSTDDETYPENNLDSLQKQDLFGDAFTAEIAAIPGIERTKPLDILLAHIDHPAYRDGGQRYSIGSFDRQALAAMETELEEGELDYDKMVREGGVIYPWGKENMSLDGLSIGDTLHLTMYDGDRAVPFEATLAACTIVRGESLYLPQDVMDRIATEVSPAAGLYIWADAARYDGIKTELQRIVDGGRHLRMYALDEEMAIAQDALRMLRFPVYGILILVGVISFMNLINTMIVSIVARRRELGILQAIGLSDRQLVRMLLLEGLFFSAGALVLALTLGSIGGYGVFLWGRSGGLLSVREFHYPVLEAALMAGAIVLGQALLSVRISKFIHRESLIERIRQE